MTMMQTPGRHEHQDALLDGTIDDMLLRLRGLVLVGGLLEQRGASADVRRAAGPPQLKRRPLGRLAAVRGWLAALVV
jgi:hypothetical protein